MELAWNNSGVKWMSLPMNHCLQTALEMSLALLIIYFIQVCMYDVCMYVYLNGIVHLPKCNTMRYFALYFHDALLILLWL